MKRILVLFSFLLALSIGAVAQTELRGTAYPMVIQAFNFKTFTNFTATSDDTTGFVKVSEANLGADFLLWPRVYLIGRATDSVNADVYVIARNGALTSITQTYADSIIGTSNTSNTKVITLAAPGTDRLPGCTQIRIGTVFRATGQGTTAGRTMKWYISAYKP